MKAIKTITKRYTTLRAAERYQWRLYDKYESVTLVRSPTFTEKGEYVWWVSRPKN